MNKCMLHFSRPALGLLALSLFACSSMQDLLQKPKLTFRDVQVKEASLTDSTLEFHFDVENPNPLGLALGNLRYAFEIGGKALSSGELPANTALPAQGHADLAVPLKIDYQQAFGSLQKLFTEDAPEYRVSGSFRVGPFEIPYSQTGRLKLPRMPRLAIKQLRLISTDPLAPTWTLELELDNPNEFSIPLEGLDYAFNLRGRDLATGRTELERMNAGQRTTLALPLRLSLADLGLALADLRKGGTTLPFRFSANVHVPRTQGFAIEQSGAIPLTR